MSYIFEDIDDRIIDQDTVMLRTGRFGTINIYWPGKDRYDMCLDWVSQNPKADITPTYIFIRDVLQKMDVIEFSDNVPPELVDMVRSVSVKPSKTGSSSTNAIKDDMVAMIAIFFCDFRNVMGLNRYSNVECTKLFRYLCEHVFVRGTKVERILEVMPLKSSPYASWRSHMFFSQPLLNCLAVEVEPRSSWSFYRYSNDLRKEMDYVTYVLPVWLRREAMRMLQPDLPVDLVFRETLPEEEFVIFSNEGRVKGTFECLEVREGLGELDCESDARPNASFVKKLTEDLDLPQIPTPLALEKNGPLVNWPGRLLTTAYCCYDRFVYEQSGAGKDFAGYLKFIPDRMIDRHFWQIVPVMFPLLKGLRKVMEPYCTLRDVRPRLLEIFSRIARSGEWTELFSIERLIIARPGTSLYSWFIVDKSYLDNHSPESKITDDTVGRDDLWETMAKGYLRGYVALLACAGLLELAFDKSASVSKGKDEGKPLYPMPELAYVRITDAGKFAFGLENKLKLNKTVSGELFDVDDIHHIVTLFETGRVYRSFFDTVGRKITPDKYKITVDSVVSKCRSENEVLSTLRRLEDLLSPDGIPSPSWKELYDGVRRRLETIGRRKGKFVCYEVEVGNEEILRIIRNDKELSDVVILGEDYRIFVPDSFKSEFETLLMANGYFL